MELLFPAVSGNHSQLVPIVAQPSSEQEISLSFTLHLPTAESPWLRAQRGDQLARLHAQLLPSPASARGRCGELKSHQSVMVAAALLLDQRSERLPTAAGCLSVWSATLTRLRPPSPVGKRRQSSSTVSVLNLAVVIHSSPAELFTASTGTVTPITRGDFDAG